MGITPWMLYVCTTLDGLNKVGEGLALIFGTLLCGSLAYFIGCRVHEAKDHYRSSGRLTFYTGILFVFFMVTTALLPSTKEAAIIFGFPYMMNTLKDTGVDKIPPKMVEYT